MAPTELQRMVNELLQVMEGNENRIRRELGEPVLSQMQALIFESTNLNQLQQAEKALYEQAIRAGKMLMALYGDSKGAPVDKKRAAEYQQQFEHAVGQIYELNNQRKETYMASKRPGVSAAEQPQAPAVSSAPQPGKKNS